MPSAVGGLLRDLKLAARRLLATPLFLIFAVASVSIGIATTTTAYSILYAVMWKPLGIVQSKDVAVVASNPIAGAPANWRNAVTIADYQLLESRPQTLEDLSAIMFVTATLVTPSSSQMASFEMVTGRFFRTVRVQPARGRTIQPEDETSRAQVLVLSDRGWRTRFASDPDIVGKVVKVAGQPFEVIGVAPATFEGVFARTMPLSGWMPMSTFTTLFPEPAQTNPMLSGRRRVAVFGRLAEGRSLLEASTEVAAIGTALDSEVPPADVAQALNGTVRRARAWSLRAIDTADDSPTQTNMGILLVTMVGLVLVVACTNLGNLTLSRGAYRQHELAVRRALGASRGRLIRELFAETMLIAVLAGVCTVLLTRTLLMFATQEFSTPLGAYSFEPRLNTPAMIVSMSTLAISMIVFGLEPAFALTRRQTAATLAEGISTSGAGRSSRQRGFIRWQVAISVCFFLIAATITKGIAKMVLHDPGIDVGMLAVTSAASIPQTAPEQLRRAVERAAEIARQRSELSSVAIANGMPFGSWPGSVGFSLPDSPPVSGPAPTALFIAASPEYFRTLGIPIVHGRQFDDRDLTSSAHVAVLSEFTAAQLFGSSGAAVGRSMTLQRGPRGSQTFTVIGVARQTDVGRLTVRSAHLIYAPLSEATGPSLTLVARTTGSPVGAARVLQEALRVADPDIGSSMSGPATWILAGQLVVGRFAAALALSLGLLTLVLAMIGLYGVQIQAVAFRTREMGVRMALGAASGQIKAMVLRQGARPVMEGMVLGLFFGVATRAIVIYTVGDVSVDVIDPVVFTAVPIPFAIAALIACYLPARRASRVDPNIALRHL